MIQTFKFLVNTVKNADKYTAFFWMLNIVNAVVMIAFSFLSLSFYEGREVVWATFALLVVQVWISISIMVATIDRKIGIFIILFGPLFMFVRMHNSVKIAVFSTSIFLLFAFLSLTQVTNNMFWFMCVTVSFYSVTVSVNCYFQIYEHFKLVEATQNGTTIDTDPLIMLLNPIMCIVQGMIVVQVSIHKSVAVLSGKKEK